ncbi:MAG: CPBP family intramembrane metalloprotease [Candidatus Lokiarchaeota archaeon]|nr:CPBP family intramembrane metalloprotease [Candidatus Lokiarchaeota archaeon]
MKFLNHMITSFEKPTPKDRDPKYEWHFVFYSIILFMLHRLLSIGLDYGYGFVIFSAVIETLSYLTIIYLATNSGINWATRQIKQNDGLSFAIIVSGACFLFQLFGVIFGFEEFAVTWIEDIETLFWTNFPWILALIVLVLGLFIGLKTVLIFSKLREDRNGLITLLRTLTVSFDDLDNKEMDIDPSNDKNIEDIHNNSSSRELLNLRKKFSIHFLVLLAYSPLIMLNFSLGWLSLLAPLALFLLFLIAKWPFFHQNKDGLTFGDVLTAGLGAGIVILYQQVLSLAWCFSLPIAAIIIFTTTGLGRFHLHFTFVPNSGKEVVELINTVLFTIVTFIPIAILVKFIDPTQCWQPNVPAATFINYMGNWIYVVGISEEFIFRCGVLIFLRDWIKHWSVERAWNKKGGVLAKVAKYPTTTALILASVIFGLAHATKGWNYAFLAILAGFIYGIPFCKNKNLFGAILLHALVDVIAVAYFCAQL